MSEKYRVNAKVKSPAGVGHVNGRHERGYWVRVPIGKANQKMVEQSETPKATLSALWIFPRQELSVDVG